jgi:ABC-type antimicrobial peptide transport system permease subunit
MFPPVSFALRTTGDPRAVSSGIRGVIHRIDAEIPLQTMRTMDDVIAASLAERRFQLGLVLLFALTATVLASLGIYGVVSYSVAQRTSEIGVRMALGAQPRQIRALVIAESLLPVAAGLVIGIAVSIGLGRVLGSLLVGIGPADPIAIAAVSLILLIVALVANYVPAVRATRVDPWRTLRCE